LKPFLLRPVKTFAVDPAARMPPCRQQSQQATVTKSKDSKEKKKSLLDRLNPFKKKDKDGN